MEEKGKGVKRGYCDSTEAVQPVVIVNEPGFVAAVGGIPDHLKIKEAHAVSVRFRFPISKYPKNLPADPTERRRVFFQDFKDVHSPKKPRRACWLCKPEKYFIVYVNAIPPLLSELYDCRASQSMEESEEEGFSYYSIRNGQVNKPRLVAVAGGVPHELKINDGISFSIPCPVFKYPKVMPIERQNIIQDCCKKGVETDAFINAFIQAYIKAKSEARGLRCSWEESHNIDQQPPTPMLEFNVAATPGFYHYLRYMDRSEAVQSVIIMDCPNGCTFLERDFADFVELVPLMGVLINKPGIVAAIGGIPNELKIEGAVTFWVRCPVLKYSHLDANGDDVDANVDDVDANVDDVDANADDVDVNSDDVLEYKIDTEVEYTKIFREGLIRAYRKVYSARHDSSSCGHDGSSSSTCKEEADAHSRDPLCPMAEVKILEEAEAHSTDPLCPMAEVNILESQFGSASDELNQDNDVET